MSPSTSSLQPGCPANPPRPGEGVRIGVLTSGGDAQGMNAAVRAVVRTGLHLGAEVYGVMEGLQGAVDGGDRIRRLEWNDVGNILHRGGTVIGTARSKDFREREGRLLAAKNLIDRGIDRLVVIGGDGSLTGTDMFRQEWTSLVEELVQRGELPVEVAAEHPHLVIAGLVGSIDNDLVGTDMTIGADSALHRIIEALDAISSTAASHQRSFVIEVMGRHCGYLPLMAAIAGGCDYVLFPERPPAPGWEDAMCEQLRAGRLAGRRDSLVLVAEGAIDQVGKPITAAYVTEVLKERLGEDARLTILGHVQRGGRPSAYDRWMSTVLGYGAVMEVLSADPARPPRVLGVRNNRITAIDLGEAVKRTKEVEGMIDRGDYESAMMSRGGSFREMVKIFDTMARPPVLDSASELRSEGGARQPRVAIMHAGGLAPGMNTAVRAAVRLGVDQGWTMLAVDGGFHGLVNGRIRELAWSDVDGWASDGGAELGTRREIPSSQQLFSVGRNLEEHQVDALLLIGGYDAYEGALRLVQERERYDAFALPIVCVPASIDNNLPGSEVSIGADTALNFAVWALDGVKQSASAARRCFVAETMGHRCGYLTLMAGIASGAERVYLPEDGITVADLQRDVERMRASFRAGKRLFLAIRNEDASRLYTSDFVARLFEQEGGDLFDVRTAILGHLQQGGMPSAFDRLLATRLLKHAVDCLSDQFERGATDGRYIGVVGDAVVSDLLVHMPEHVDQKNRRPLHQWWLELKPVVVAVAEPDASPDESTVQVLTVEQAEKLTEVNGSIVSV
ncbi:multiprotein-bridging factor 1b [Platysternon megacephalum]|uniref:6-phosphofructokinase n=1 Tax=Platysternon megacephalum TaxID=55544 RepID=A0A4D9DEY0_9SAUR|nr:multiprotein-bridging factor 1b [Platysternon megacephalum]